MPLGGHLVQKDLKTTLSINKSLDFDVHVLMADLSSAGLTSDQRMVVSSI